MGGAVSAGANNDELIDNLLEADYIKSDNVERVFRAVDRGHYFTSEYKERAYRDLAWKCGNIHISAPCIYSRVMENLQLGPGMSFLNLGSGTGYLSTMAGLLLGSYGTNHGIEIHEDVLNYSNKKLDEFLSTSSAIDEYDFCEPKFISGNCLHLSGCARQYDRVYCGAACPENHENYMKNLIKVGGILVMPINDQLLQICRTSDANWESKAVLPVSFASLIFSKVSACTEPLKMPDLDPLSLQDICRFTVRSILRRNIDIEHPELKKPFRPRKHIKKKNFRRIVIPIFNSTSDIEDQDSNESETLTSVNNSQTCRSVVEWRHILQGTSSELLNAFESQWVSNTNSVQNSEPSDSLIKDLDIVEGDSNFISQTKDSNEIFEEVSDEELSSDIEELNNILKADTSTSLVSSENDCDIKMRKCSTACTIESDGEQQKFEHKSKREKIDSGIVEDIEAKEISSDSEEETDDDFDESPCNLLGSSFFLNTTKTRVSVNSHETENEEGSINPKDSKIAVNNYTTYMKEKIKLLPLPMTLKYFLNLNREF